MCTIHTNAQFDTLADLEKALANVVNLEERCSLYYEIAEQHFNDWELDLAKYNFQLAFQTAKEINNTVMQSKALSSIGACYQDSSVPDSALLFANRAMEIIANDSTKAALEQKSAIHSQLGLLYTSELSNNKEALKHFILCLDFAKKAQSPSKLIDAHIGMALIYSVFDHSKCIRYGKEGLTIAKQEKDLYKIAELQRIMAQSILMNRAKKNSSNKNDLDKAFLLIKHNIAYYQKNNNQFELADSWLSLSKYFSYVNQVDSAANYIIKSFELFKELDSETAVISAGIDLADILYQQKKYKKVIELLEPFTKSLKLNQNLEFLRLVLGKLASSYEKTGQYDKAFNSLKFFENFSKKYYEKNWDASSLEMQAKYNTEWLEKEKVLLEERNHNLLFRNQIFMGIVILFLLLLLFGTWLFRKTKLKNQLIEKQKIELQKLDTTRNKLFSIIAHDLRSPLVSLQGIPEKFNYLINKNRTEDIHKLSQSIESSIESVNKLIDNLLNWALMEQGRFPHHPEAINIAEMIDDVIRLYQNRVDSKNIQLKLNVPNQLFAHADKNATTTVLRNLIDNAIKFTCAGGTVNIFAENKSDHIVISIEDTGIGIPYHELNTLLVRNILKTKKGTAGEKGTGLGLVLCKELIEMNSGSLDIKSKEGIGSIFSVYLPMHNSNNKNA